MLVVDDDADFRALAARILAAIGVQQILMAPTAEAALTEAAAHRPRAALVDVGLPDRNGADLARELHSLAWSPRVVVTSSDRDAVTIVDSVFGVDRVPFLPKEDLTEGELARLFGAP